VRLCCSPMQRQWRTAAHRYVARVLNEAKLATLLIDLLTLDEEVVDARRHSLRFDTNCRRELVGATDWLAQDPIRSASDRLLRASTAPPPALVAAAVRFRLVECGGLARRPPDLAGAALMHVRAPTLLIVGETTPGHFQLNREALRSCAAKSNS